MDALIRHRVAVVVLTESGTEGLGALVQDLVAYFYVDNVLVALPQPKRLYRLFDILTNFFNQVSLQTKVSKMVSMACQTYHTSSGMSETAYSRWTTGVGPSYWKRLR